MRKLLIFIMTILILLPMAGCKKKDKTEVEADFIPILEKAEGQLGIKDNVLVLKKDKANYKLSMFLLEKTKEGYSYDDSQNKLMFTEAELREMNQSLQTYLESKEDNSKADYDEIKLELNSVSKALLDADSPIVVSGEGNVAGSQNEEPSQSNNQLELELELEEDTQDTNQDEIVLDLDTEGLDKNFKEGQGELKYADFGPKVPLDYFVNDESVEAEVDMESFDSMEEARAYAESQKVLMQKDFLLREVTCNDGAVRWGVFWYQTSLNPSYKELERRWNY